ncbi:MAG: choice-of-anchor L domain-containing protein [Bacteroidales bacterium]|nr:choice-of-anchor L domain-containing protein [Bacteroidales bacterium]
MKKNITLAIGLIFSVATLKAQIAITADTNTVQLVNNFIIFGVSASNVQYTGGAHTLGSFTNGITTNIGLSDGIIMTTGSLDTTQSSVVYIGSPVNEFASFYTSGGSDSSLSNILPGYSLNDASILEFDLIPVGNILEFSYVFASEEYPEYVNSAFNDIFGFFINGPDPLGGNYADHNIAIVPGTSLPVAIDNVNSGYNAAYYVDNQALNGQTIVFDGFTTPLLAQVDVIPLSTYHLKMAIADAGDAAYDSGIFLKAQSMKSYMITGTDHKNAQALGFYPNPTSGKIYIEGANETQVFIYNLQGQLLFSQTITSSQNAIDTDFLENGIYLLTMITEGETVNSKLVIK